MVRGDLNLNNCEK